MHSQQNIWLEYYQAFPYFLEKTVRAGCHPRKMLHSSGDRQAIVLVHGLSDSPYFMSAIGDYFHTVLGYNVYIPLLQCHGLQAQDMAEVALDLWLDNVRFAICAAAEKAERISIGGFSLGGAISYYLSRIDPVLNADLYIFSAALGLPAGPCGIPAWFKERVLRMPFVKKLKAFRPLVGKNPYRYERVSLNSAAELAQLLFKINELPEQFTDAGNSARRIFAAWSECDKVINLDKLRDLQRCIPENRFMSFIISAADEVQHASVVLQCPIFPLGSKPGSAPLELANPRFTEMLTAIGRFADCGSLRV